MLQQAAFWNPCAMFANAFSPEPHHAGEFGMMIKCYKWYGRTGQCMGLTALGQGGHCLQGTPW